MATIADTLALALQHHKAGRLPEAEALYRQILQVQPDHPDSLHLLGVIAHQAGKHEVAVAYITRAIALNPDSPGFHNNIGEAYRALGKPEEATACYGRALALRPNFAEPHYNMAIALKSLGQAEEAIAHYREAVRLNPAYAEAYNNLGAVLRDQGRLAEAIECYRQAIALQPAFAETYNELGACFTSVGNVEEAAVYYQKAIALNPSFAFAHKNLGTSLRDQGNLEGAVAQYRQALALMPNDGLKILIATLLPIIPESKEHLLQARRNYEERMARLLEQNLMLSDPSVEVGATQFYLAYQGCNDRDLQIQIARLYERACPSLLYTAPHCLSSARLHSQEKVKVGFISRFLKHHSIGKTTRGILANLSRDRFCVYAFFVPPPAHDEIAAFIQRSADRAVFLPNNLQAARERIAEEELDVLFYQDIGMEPLTYFLAFSRLAPVQCSSFGHPVTSGIKNIDYFISTENWEPEEGEKHYSEKLIRLKSNIAYYYKPTVPNPLKSRSQFGLDELEHLYLCPHALFKFHPEFDEILRGILRADPRGRLVLVGGKVEHWTELLLQRFKRTMPQVVERITVLPPQTGHDFINLIAIADVMLDTIHFCGFNTNLEAFAVGTPVVTLPGEYQRGRHTLAFYKEMGFLDCVADSPSRYIEIAVRLGTDSGYREAIKAKVLANNHALYENREVVGEFERFFIGSVEDARKAEGRRICRDVAPKSDLVSVRSSGRVSCGRTISQSEQLVADFQQQLISTFEAIIPRERPIVLIDFPDALNCGDLAIWGGEKTLLRTRGIAPAYECSMQSYDESKLKRAVKKDGVILMHGGGNFGDIYIYHGFRERVVASFPDNEIIVFPQTVKFYHQQRLVQSQEVFCKHPRVTIFARDLDSYNFLAAHFPHSRVMLCPDMAFLLGCRDRMEQPCTDILFLCRTDGESRYAKGSDLGFDATQYRRGIVNIPVGRGAMADITLAVDSFEDVQVTDWYKLQLAFRRKPEGPAYFQELSDVLIDCSMKILSRGQVVVSDRLHAHILCLLMNIPHVLIDNNYGKLSSFYRTWTSRSDITHWAQTPAEAIEIARNLLRGSSEPEDAGTLSPSGQTTVVQGVECVKYDISSEEAELIADIRRRNLTYCGYPRLENICTAIRQIISSNVHGVFIEAGIGLGGSSILIAKLKPDAVKFYMYDVFGMIPPPSEKDGPDVHRRYQEIAGGCSKGLGGDTYYGYVRNLKEVVKTNLAASAIDLTRQNIVLIEGLFQDSMRAEEPVAFAHIDCDWYESVKTCIERITPRMTKGAIIIFDDYSSWSGCKKAVDDFMASDRRFSVINSENSLTLRKTRE